MKQRAENESSAISNARPFPPSYIEVPEADWSLIRTLSNRNKNQNKVCLFDFHFLVRNLFS